MPTTKRLFTDETGQSIVTTLTQIKNALDPSSVLSTMETATTNANTATTAANNAAAAALTAASTANTAAIAANANVAAVYERANVETISRQKTAIGNPIVITDAVAEVADKLVIRLDPKQDLHGYSKPWVGGAGKNLVCINQATQITLSNGLVFTPIGDGSSFKLSGTVSSSSMVFSNVHTANQSPDATQADGVKHFANGTYKLVVWKNGTLDTSVMQLQIYGSNSANTTSLTRIGNSTIDNGVATVDNTYAYNFARIAISAGTYSNDVFRIMICKSTDDYTTWEPYSNICPITGYDAVTVKGEGNNLLDTVGRTNGRYINSSGNTNIDTSFCYTDLIPVKGGHRYVLHGKANRTSASNRRVHLYNDNGTWIGQLFAVQTESDEEYSHDDVISAGASYVKISYPGYTGAGRTDVDANPTFAEYAAYPITLSTASRTVSGTTTTAGTVFGGELTLNRDGSGTIAVDNVRKICTGVDEAWNINSGTGGTTYFVHQVGAINTVVTDYAVCDSFPQASISSSTTNIGITMANSSARNGAYIFVRPNNADSYASADAFKEFLQAHNITIVYKLTTPVTYTLTAQQVQTLLGYNYIYYADNGTMELTYRQEALATNETLLGLLPTGTATGNPITISDGAKGIPLKKLKINIEPWQDLHGYTKPWVGGAGKNLVNFDGSAKSNATIFEMMYDEAGNFAGVKGTGTPTGSAYLGTLFTLPAGEYILSGAPAGSGQSITSVSVRLGGLNGNNVATSYGTDVTFTAQEGVTYCLCCLAASGINTTGKIWKPMIRKASVSDATWEPYKNLCPIRGWDAVNVPRAGKNLFDGKKIDGYISDEGVVGTDGYGAHSDFIPVTEGASYTYSCVSNISSTINRRIHAYDANKNWKQMINKNGTSGAGSKSATFTVPSGARYIVVQFYGGASANAASMDTNIQVEQGSSATTYEPYNGQEETIKLPTTVYGGTLILDEYGEGELTVDMAKTVLNGTESLTVSDGSQGANAVNVFAYLGITGAKLALGNCISDKLQSVSPNVIATELVTIQGGCVTLRTASAGPAILVPFSALDGVTRQSTLSAMSTAVKAWLAADPLTLVYKLATPLTYHLTANQLKTLLGSNTIWCDAGSVEVDYACDIKLYIDKKFAELLAQLEA